MSYLQTIKIKKMRKLIIYAICLFVLPAYSQTSKIKIKPEELSQFKAIKNTKSFFSANQNTSLAHKKKTYQWNATTENWEYYSENNYEYDADGRIILEERRELIDNVMELVYGYKLEIDSINPNKEIITQKLYNFNLKVYENMGKEIITKENGLNVEMVYMTWDGSNWINESAEAYDYNNRSEISSIIKVKWVDNQWQNEELMYNIVWKNVLLMEPYSFELKTWNGNNWMNESKVEYSYSRNGGITSIGYIFEDNQWKYQYRFIDEFDSNNNRSKITFELFDQNNWIVQFENKFIHTYDSQQRLLETITQIYEGNTWTNLIKEEYSEYNVSTGISSEKSLAINIFPNPTTDIINFKLEENQGMAKLMITDLSGRVVLENEIDLSNTKSVNVQELNNAYYILNIQVADKKYHQKFIKK